MPPLTSTGIFATSADSTVVEPDASSGWMRGKTDAVTLTVVVWDAITIATLRPTSEPTVTVTFCRTLVEKPE